RFMQASPFVLLKYSELHLCQSIKARYMMTESIIPCRSGLLASPQAQFYTFDCRSGLLASPQAQFCTFDCQFVSRGRVQTFKLSAVLTRVRACECSCQKCHDGFDRGILVQAFTSPVGIADANASAVSKYNEAKEKIHWEVSLFLPL